MTNLITTRLLNFKIATFRPCTIRDLWTYGYQMPAGRP